MSGVIGQPGRERSFRGKNTVLRFIVYLKNGVFSEGNAQAVVFHDKSVPHHLRNGLFGLLRNEPHDRIAERGKGTDELHQSFGISGSRRVLYGKHRIHMSVGRNDPAAVPDEFKPTVDLAFLKFRLRRNGPSCGIPGQVTRSAPRKIEMVLVLNIETRHFVLLLRLFLEGFIAVIIADHGDFCQGKPAGQYRSAPSRGLCCSCLSDRIALNTLKSTFFSHAICTEKSLMFLPKYGIL